MGKYGLLALLAMIVLACAEEQTPVQDATHMRFEVINYFKYPVIETSKPFRYKVTYYFDNGIPYRWIDLDATGKVFTDYIYEYDSQWNHIGARYTEEPGEEEYALEKVRFENDSTQITEWLNSEGNVYYTMTDNLNKDGKTYRATFKGDEVHGYDSTLYTPEGFVKRIFFTNIKGKVFNDRSFIYDSTNTRGDWLVRKKVMGDTIREIQIREVYYDDNFASKKGIFYPGLLSTGEFAENTFSFTKGESQIFLTRTSDWDNQYGYISTKKNGLFTSSVPLQILDTIYNGALSPDGSMIIYTKKVGDVEQLMLLKKTDDSWSEKINLTERSNLQGGYFYWHTMNELYFYIPENNGDIAAGKLEENQFVITDSLKILNSAEGNEFSPFVDPEKRFIIFTRYTEGDESQQGFFISYNTGDSDSPKWGIPEKLSPLPYGWNAYISEISNQFLYTNGEDIKSIPLDSLNLEL